MPQFHVTSSPVQISQMTTQAALIQNLSATETVYLDVQSSVSVGAYGTALAPRSAMTWQSDTPLWAVSANDADVSVMYGADSAALGEVSVVGTVNVDGNIAINGPVSVDQITSTVNIDGTVAVDLPVNVQGGGEPLYQGGHLVPPYSGSHFSIPITAPANGLTYYGMRFALRVTGNAPETTVGYEIVTGVGSGFIQAQGTIARWTSARTIKRLGVPSHHVFTIPTLADYPYELRLYNFTGGNVPVSVDVNGVSAADPYPRTDWSLQTHGSVMYSGAVVPAANSPILLPASYNDYSLRIYRPGTSDLSALATYQVGFDGTLMQQDIQLQQGTNAGEAFTVRVPGTGYASALMSTAANVNNFYVSLRPEV